MSLADEIRNSFVLPESYFEQNVIPFLKGCGRASIICDNHIYEVKGNAIPTQYGNSLESWARKNGFNVSHEVNSYGVRYIRISI